MISTPICHGLAFGRVAGVGDGGRLTGLFFIAFMRLSRVVKKNRYLGIV